MFGSAEAQLLSDEPAVYSGDETNEDSMKEVDYYREPGGESLDLEEKPDIKTLGVQPEQDANVNRTSGKNNQISLRLIAASRYGKRFPHRRSQIFLLLYCRHYGAADAETQ